MSPTHIVRDCDRACPNCLSWEWFVLERNEEGVWACDKCSEEIDNRIAKLPPRIQELVDAVSNQESSRP